MILFCFIHLSVSFSVKKFFCNLTCLAPALPGWEIINLMSVVKLSIIIPMKNEEAYIEPCLQALINNDFPKEAFEIICIDNGSTDRTMELARKYTEHVFQVPDRTISHLRNFGAQKAKGEYLAFVDADCIVDRFWIQAASHYFGDEKVVCFGSTPEIPEDATWVQKTWFLNKQSRKEVQEVEWLESMNLFVKKDVLREMGGFNERLETCEDVDLCYRIGEKYQIVSDKKIKSQHLGEAKTVKEFFKKEMWRGKSNLKGLKEHGIKPKELPSIILPLYYLLLPLLFIVLLYTNAFFLATLAFIVLLIAPPLLISIYITSKISKYNYILKTFFIYLVYFIARAKSFVF